MTDADLPPRLTRLTFHGPLSEARASRIVARLAGNTPGTVLESGYQCHEEEWLAAHRDDLRAAEIRNRATRPARRRRTG